MNSFFKKFFVAAIPLCLSASVVNAAEFATLNIKQQTSRYMDMGKRITRIAVGDPAIATVVQLPGSVQEFLIVTKAKGSTALFVWTADGARYEYLIVVSPEDPGQAMMIEKAIGLPNVHVKYVDGRLLLTGTVENQYEKNYALQTARLFVNATTESSLLVGSGFDMKLDTSAATDTGRSEDLEASKSETTGAIIDLIQILHPTQIRLEAQIIEINSDDARELGLQYGTEPTNSPGIFSFGEDYTRSGHTSISETSSSGWSNSYSGGNSNSYSGGDSSSYSSTRNWTSDGNSYTDEYNYDYSNSTSDSSRNGSNSNSRNNDYSNSRNSSFNRTVTSTWNDLRRFGNNPLKWIGQHFAPINVRLSVLVNNGKAKILSRPSVMTLSGEQATIQIGGKIPYTTTNSNGSTNTQFENYGIILQFKPIVDEQSRINSIVHAEVSNIGDYMPNGLPTITTRSADSIINLFSGSPIVIGGLMNSEEVKKVTKIPLLGDIPIIGEFFKNTSKSRDKRELIIVVTPYLVGDEERSQTMMSQPMRDWYTQHEKQREAMESHDFKKPEEEIIVEVEKEPESILPPPNYPKDGKTTDTPFK